MYVSTFAVILFRFVEFTCYSNSFFQNHQQDTVGNESFNLAEWASINLGLSQCVSMLLFGFQIQDVRKFYASSQTKEDVANILKQFNTKRLVVWIVDILISVGCLSFVIIVNYKQRNIIQNEDVFTEQLDLWNRETDIYSAFYVSLCIFLIGSFVFLWYELRKFNESMEK